MFARFIGFGVGHKSQYQSEKMGRIVHDGDPEDENDPAREGLPDETESVVSLGEEIEENDGDGDGDDREDVNGDGDVDNIGEDVEEDQSEDDIDEHETAASEDGDELVDFEF